MFSLPTMQAVEGFPPLSQPCRHSQSGRLVSGRREIDVELVAMLELAPERGIGNLD